ncbi:hypothetical protein HMPREF1992_02288 [Selenomonas sp. oral taxon 892 str. F0426]|nr:hypothetical protein HMPREF1992_02288 [Selenomonas sp. oral taxon 892 str. F0426]
MIALTRGEKKNGDNPSITLRSLFRHAKKDNLTLFAAHVYEGSAS